MRAQEGWVIAGLGNPGDEYEGTRHNAGRETVEVLAKKLPPKTTVILPDVYMNNSGGPLRKLIASKKAAEKLVVVHDDLDLPLGSVKISFGSGSGGHRGVESVIKAIKTKDFVRVRMGISPSTPSGKTKKPDAKKIVDFVLGKFRPSELEKLKKARKKVGEALDLLITKGRAAAMNEINSK